MMTRVAGFSYQNGGNYQKTYKYIHNGYKLYIMAKRSFNIPNVSIPRPSKICIPKLGFLVYKYTIWQP
jgi:hypothetical protein